MFKVLLYGFSKCRHNNIPDLVNNQELYHVLFCCILGTLKFYTIQYKTAQVSKFSKMSLGQGTQFKTCKAFIIFFF